MSRFRQTRLFPNLLARLSVPLRPLIGVVLALALPLVVPDEAITRWSAPVAASVLDPFRPPTNPYGAGNRGIEYATSGGDEVSAVAPGVVVFSGSVASSWFVTVFHGTVDPGTDAAAGPQPLRSTYGFIDPPLVAKGERVERGQLIATTGPGFHLTARIGARYVDPATYLEAGELPLRFEVHLVAAPG